MMEDRQLTFSLTPDTSIQELRQRRIHAGLTQRDVSSAIGVTHRVVRHWENGDYSPPSEAKAKYEQFLDEYEASGQIAHKPTRPRAKPRQFEPRAPKIEQKRLRRIVNKEGLPLQELADVISQTPASVHNKLSGRRPLYKREAKAFRSHIKQKKLFAIFGKQPFTR